VLNIDQSHAVGLDSQHITALRATMHAVAAHFQSFVQVQPPFPDCRSRDDAFAGASIAMDAVGFKNSEIWYTSLKPTLRFLARIHAGEDCWLRCFALYQLCTKQFVLYCVCAMNGASKLFFANPCGSCAVQADELGKCCVGSCLDYQE
jgi:hypothetical protein